MKNYLINDYNKGIMSDYIEVQANSPKKAAEKYLSSKLGGTDEDISVQEGRIEDGQEIFKFGAAQIFYFYIKK